MFVKSKTLLGERILSNARIITVFVITNNHLGNFVFVNALPGKKSTMNTVSKGNGTGR